MLVMMGLFAAAAFQSASGLGFGLVAGPILVATLGVSMGLQVAVLLNLLVATAAWGLGRKDVRYDLLYPMAPGVICGLAGGFGISLVMPDWAMKAAMCVALSWVWLARQRQTQCTRVETFRLSAIAGAMGGALGIPGPAAAVHLRRQAPDVRAFRSSMMPLLAAIYLVSGFGVYAAKGIDPSVLNAVLTDGPAVVAGLGFGVFATRSASERVLHWLARAILMGTFAAILGTTLIDIWTLLGIASV